MPPWALDELEALRAYMATNVTEAMLADRFHKWGGSVRYCLSPAAKFGDVRLSQAIGHVDVNNLIKLVQLPDTNPVHAWLFGGSRKPGYAHKTSFT